MKSFPFACSSGKFRFSQKLVNDLLMTLTFLAECLNLIAAESQSEATQLPPQLPSPMVDHSNAGKVMQATILELEQQLTAKEWLLLQLQVLPVTVSCKPITCFSSLILQVVLLSSSRLRVSGLV